MKDIAIYGAGGFGKELACLLGWINESVPTWNLIGFFDDRRDQGTNVSHFGKVLGGMDALNAWPTSLSLVIAIGSSNVIRTLSGRVTNPLIDFPNIVSPDFTIKDNATFRIGKGNIIQGKCVASCDVRIGDFNVFNGSVVMGHDVTIGNYNVIMPGTRISGEVTMGNCNFLGVGSIVLQGLRIGSDIRLAAGSTLMTRPKDNSLYLGVPAKLMKY